MVWVVEKRLVLTGPKVGSFYPVFKFGSHKQLYSFKAAQKYAQLNNLPAPPSQAGARARWARRFRETALETHSLLRICRFYSGPAANGLRAGGGKVDCEGYVCWSIFSEDSQHVCERQDLYIRNCVRLGLSLQDQNLFLKFLGLGLFRRYKLNPRIKTSQILKLGGG